MHESRQVIRLEHLFANALYCRCHCGHHRHVAAAAAAVAVATASAAAIAPPWRCETIAEVLKWLAKLDKEKEEEEDVLDIFNPDK